MRELERELRQGLSTLSLDLDDLQVTRLLDYLELIQKWTKVYNLTAVRVPSEMLTHHLLDSLAVINPLRRQVSAIRASGVECPQDGRRANAEPIRLLDVGSGAGLPGVVIAICCPAIVVDCVDTVAKKAAFVRQVAAALRLPNLHGLHARVESLTDKYSVISCRALAALRDFTSWSGAALAEHGIWMAMKGKQPLDEVAALPPDVEVFHVEPLLVPGLQAERCIVWMRRPVAPPP